MVVIESITAGGACDPGLVRESNEDRCFFRAFVYTGELGQERGLIAAVADGMGGHAAGEAASERAIQVLASRFSRMASVDLSRQVSPDWPSLLREAFVQANREVYEEAGRWAGRSGMGTTLTAAIIAGDVMYFGHVGDSRAYLIRNGRIVRLTNDDTWVARRVREGYMSAHEAEMSDRRGQLTEAIGLKGTVQPEVDAIGLRPGDRIILCTDGITEMLSETDILSTAESGTDVQRTAMRLVDAANRAGGYDNSAVVVIDCQGEPSRRQIRIPKLPRRPPKWAILALALVMALLVADAVYLASRHIRGGQPTAAQVAPEAGSQAGGFGAPVPEGSDVDRRILDLSGRPVEVSPNE